MNNRATVFALLFFATWASVGHAEKSGLSGAASIYEVMGVTAAAGDVTRVYGSLSFAFNDAFHVSLSDHYARPYGSTVFDPSGFSDIGVTLHADKLIDRPKEEFNLSGYAGYVIPISTDSQTDDLNTSAEVGLDASQKAGRYTFDLGTALSRYFFEYDTDPSGTGFNNAYGWSTSISFSTKLSDWLTNSLKAGFDTDLDYGQNVTTRYLVAIDFNAKVMTGVHLKAGIHTLRASHDLFDARATSARIGAALSF